MSDRAVIVEFDFTALNGAELLFGTAKRFLADLDGLALDAPTEARYLAGGNYQGGLTELFAAVKTKKTAAKAARELAGAFEAVLVPAVREAAVSPGVRSFVKVLSDRGVRVVLATRADLAAVESAFASLLGENVVLYRETSACYGAVKWDSWRRACAANRVRVSSTLAVTGSGYGVKAALLAGMGSVAVVNDHVAYQDFTGADDVVRELSAKTARRILELLRI